MVLHGNIVLLLLGGLQGLLLSFLLLRKKAWRKGFGFLLLYLTVMTGQILLKVVDKAWLMQNVKTAYVSSYSFPLMYGPLIWLLTRNFIAGKEVFISKDSLHFLPFFASCLAFLFVHYGSAFWWIRLPFEGWVGLAVQLTMLSGYHYFAFRMWRSSALAGESEHLRLQWLRLFILHSWWICAVVSSMLLLAYSTYPDSMLLRSGFVLLTVFIYWVSYCAVSRPDLFVPTANEFDRKLSGSPVAAAATLRAERKYANSSLKEAEAVRIAERLQTSMQLEKAFTDPGLTIEKLAALANTNRHALSQVLNERLGLSFFDYVNGLRVEEAKRLLADPAFHHHKIAAVAHDAGFNSLSVFNDAFKKLTGQTPSEFRKAPQKNFSSHQE